MEATICEHSTHDPNSPQQPATNAGFRDELRALATIFMDIFLKMSPEQRRSYEINAAIA